MQIEDDLLTFHGDFHFFTTSCYDPLHALNAPSSFDKDISYQFKSAFSSNATFSLSFSSSIINWSFSSLSLNFEIESWSALTFFPCFSPSSYYFWISAINLSFHSSLSLKLFIMLSWTNCYDFFSCFIQVS